MFSSNTETRISATYQDSDGTIDLVVDDMTANTDNYVNSVSFGSGTLTIGRTGSLSNLTTTIPLSGITGNFTDLDDTPANYSGDANKYVKVNSSANGLTFVTASTVGGDISYNDLLNLPTIPSNNNQLTNGAGYITSFTNTTYGISAVDGDNSDEEKVRLTGSNPSSTDDVVFEAGTGLSIARSGDKITFTNTDTGSSGAFPSGTRMLFQQTSAPTGWTKVTSGVNNRALRIVTGSVGSGGSNGFTNVLNSSITTGSGSVSSHTLTTAQIPAHFHYSFRSGNAGQLRNGSNLSSNNYPGSGTGAGNMYETYNITARNEIPDVGRTQEIGSSQGHSHGFTNPNFNLNVAYTDVIIAQKN